MPALPSRIQIHEYLRKNQTATSIELAHALGMTAANIRHHLDILETNDIIEVVEQRRKEGKGRPVNVYTLSRRVLGDNLDRLSDGILQEWLQESSADTREIHLKAVARRIAFSGSESFDITQDIPFLQRLNRTVKALNEMHYDARWEAAALGPRIFFSHCPYRAIVHLHPELCVMDAHLLSCYLGEPVKQTARLESSSRGLPFCAFQVE